MGNSTSNKSRNKRQQTQLPDLPVEMWTHVLSFLKDRKTLTRASMVSTTWKELAERRLNKLSPMKIVCGRNFTIFLTKKDGVYALGSNNKGQLGTGNCENRYTPTKIDFFKNNIKIVDIAAGYEHAVALADDGRVYTWGNNDKGQLGEKTSKNKTSTPQLVSSLKGVHVIKVYAGSFHAIALTEEGQVYSWGSNGEGQLGQGDTKDRKIPKQIPFPEGEKVVSIAVGKGHAIALTEQERVFGWGWNTSGQLGQGNIRYRKNKNTPTELRFFQENNIKVVALVAAEHNSYALTKDSVYSWGSNSCGQLGLGKIVGGQATPQLIKSLKGKHVVALFVSDSQMFALTDQDEVYGCGANGHGTLGLGRGPSENTPKLISSFTNINVVTIAGSFRRTFALTKEGYIYACGDSEFLGFGKARQNILKPQKIPDKTPEENAKHKTKTAPRKFMS